MNIVEAENKNSVLKKKITFSKREVNEFDLLALKLY